MLSRPQRFVRGWRDGSCKRLLEGVNKSLYLWMPVKKRLKMPKNTITPYQQ